MEWLMFGAGWVTGWLVLGFFCALLVVWGLCAASAHEPPRFTEEIDAHERLTWRPERNGHRANGAAHAQAREARPWQF